jgi:adenylate cyclase
MPRGDEMERRPQAPDDRERPRAEGEVSSRGIEVERKFIVTELPRDIERFPADPVEQGYLAIGEDGVEVRLRRRADRTLLTVKSGPGLVRVEEEMPIEEERFASLWPLTEGRRVVKTRYLVPLDPGLTVELDVYAEDLDGLLTAEIEFPSEAASLEFTPPPWLGREITGDARYANQALALHGRPPEDDQ